MLKTVFKNTTALIAVTTLGASLAAYAQEAQVEGTDEAQATEADDIGLEEVVVTARRHAERMQDVPISMTAVSRLDMDRSGYQTLGDVSLGVPNFSFIDRGSVLGDFGMRGITTNVSNPGVESAMTVYIDGIPIGRPQAFDYLLQGVQQVEVLRGPQGTLFGKNTIAGALNITSQRPTDEVSGNMKLETGRYNRGMASGSLNFPIAGDKLMARISASVERQTGWIRNLFDDRRFNGQDNWSGRVQLLAHPTDKLEIYWTADRFFDDRNFIAQVNDDPASLKDNPAVNIDKGIVDIDSPSTSRRNLWGTSLEANYSTDAGYVFTFLGGFRQTNFNSLFDGDTQRQALSDTKADDNTDQWTAELRVASPDGRKLEWTAGFFYFNQNIDASTQTRFFPKNILAGCTVPVTPQTFRGFPPPPPFEPTSRLRGFDAAGLPVWDFDLNGNGIPNEPGEAIGCHNPDLIAFARHVPGGQAEDFLVRGFDGPLTTADVPAVQAVHEFGTVNTNSYALYAHADYHFTGALTLTGGVRHTWENKSADLTQIGLINISRPSFSTQRNRKDREWSGTGSLTYKWSDDVTTYAKYTHGFKSGGFQFDITQGEKVNQFVAATKRLNPADFATKQDFINAAIALGADPNVAPDSIDFGTENVNTYEVGFKSNLFNNRLRIDIAGFYTDYNKIQQNILNLATGIVVLNVPGARIVGFEADVTARPIAGLTFKGGVGVADSKITGSLSIPNPDPTQPPLVDTSAFLGLRLAQSPNVTGNASITYEVPVTSTGSLVIRGEWTHTGSIFHELDPNPAQRAKVFEPSFDLFNGRIGYVSDSDDWEIFFWGKNITNKRYKAFRRSNPIIRNFGVPPGGAFVGGPPAGFPGTSTGQSIAGMPRTWGVTVQKHF